MKLDSKAGAAMARRERGWREGGAGWWRGGELPAGPRPPHWLAHLPALTSIWIHLLMNREDSSSIYFHVSFWGIREPEVLMLGC